MTHSPPRTYSVLRHVSAMGLVVATVGSLIYIACFVRSQVTPVCEATVIECTLGAMVPSRNAWMRRDAPASSAIAARTLEAWRFSEVWR